MRKPTFALLSVALFGLCALVGCSNSPTGSGKINVRELTPLEKQNVNQSNHFSFSLFNTVNKAETGNNVFISPLSVSYALGMVLNGADRTTKSQIDSMLGWNGVSDDDINSSYETLSDYLINLDPKVTMNIANSIWYKKGVPVEANFLNVNNKYFSAEVSALDFASPDAVTTINSWVDAKTNHKISKVLDTIPRDEVMYLINAIYFNGSWKYKFDEANTTNSPFYSDDGNTNTIELMHTQTDFPYCENEEYQAVELPYGDSLYSMVVILPKAGISIEQLSTAFNQSDFENIGSRLSVYPVEISLPRFELNYNRLLNADLKSMGMIDAFDPSKADLSRICKALSLYVTDVDHITYVKVNEAGTEAAAVTVVGIGATIAEPSSVTMNVDRPFLFLIHERNSGAILFMGKVVKL
ncbi:MAG TPA: serpin family protein [Candidatus Kryptonia bacterium]